jgi:methylmalonyl-CoA mutase
MASDAISLSGDFPPATREAWAALVEKTLKGASLPEARVGGVTVKALYTAADGCPSVAPVLAPRDAERPWDVRTSIGHPDPAGANREALADLEGGAASILVRIDPTGAEGVAIGSADALARVLDQVEPELATIAVDAGFLGPMAAHWLDAAAKASPSAKLAFHLDPFSALARAGASPGPLEAHMISAAGVAARLADTYPAASLFLASGRVVHEAGGEAAQELGFAAAAALAYAKALVRAGLSMEQAFGRITLGLAADQDYFLTIAKLRAARAIWARVVEACGISAPAVVEARSSGRMLTRLDAWTNMLRLTVAGFGAAAGGADAIVLGTFTDALGHPGDLARRQSRNAQLVLMEEAGLARVADPAGGAWAVEAMTDQMARAGWAAFQAIEAEGGLLAALASGRIAAEAAASLEARRAALADKSEKVIGVTVFPSADKTPVPVETVAPTAAIAPPTRLPGPDSRCPPLTPVRLTEPFEAAA